MVPLSNQKLSSCFSFVTNSNILLTKNIISVVFFLLYPQKMHGIIIESHRIRSDFSVRALNRKSTKKTHPLFADIFARVYFGLARTLVFEVLIKSWKCCPASTGFLSFRFYFPFFSWLSLPLIFPFIAGKGNSHLVKTAMKGMGNRSSTIKSICYS